MIKIQIKLCICVILWLLLCYFNLVLSPIAFKQWVASYNMFAYITWLVGIICTSHKTKTLKVLPYAVRIMTVSAYTGKKNTHASVLNSIFALL